jgi:hypothetical protein
MIFFSKVRQVITIPLNWPRSYTWIPQFCQRKCSSSISFREKAKFPTSQPDFGNNSFLNILLYHPLIVTILWLWVFNYLIIGSCMINNFRMSRTGDCHFRSAILLWSQTWDNRTIRFQDHLGLCVAHPIAFPVHSRRFVLIGQQLTRNPKKRCTVTGKLICTGTAGYVLV